jgi:hypothetical protein
LGKSRVRDRNARQRTQSLGHKVKVYEMTTNDLSDFFSPHTGSDRPLSLDEKIEFFVRRTVRLQIQPAIEMQHRGILNRGFAQLLIVLSIFEMIGKYRAGFVGEGDSAKYFKEGLRWTFREISDAEVALLDTFYKSVRCGLYHAGMTRPNVYLVSGRPGSFGFMAALNMLAIDPDLFVDDVRIRFEAYASELRDPGNAELRLAFERRFDDDDSYGASP